MRGGATTLRLLAAIMLLPACAFSQFYPATPLPQPLMSHTAEVLGGRVYVAGGLTDLGTNGGYLNSVYYCASMNEDGTLGAWQPAAAMPEFLGLGLHASAAYNNRLYVLGGNNMAGHLNRVYVSDVNADGTLTGWRQTTRLPQRLYAHSAAVQGGRLYVTGGIARGIGAAAQVYSAPVNADGTLGAWRQENPLPAPLFGHRSLARGGRLIVLGGSSSPELYSAGGLPAGGVSRAVYSAAVNADGTLGAWTAQPQLPAQLAFYGMVASEKSVYLLGGFDGGVVNSVYFSPISADGALGSWQALHALPQNLLSLAAVSTEKYLYSIGGGLSYLDDPTAGIYFSKIQAEPKAFVKMSPSSINKGANGKWVTVIVGLPEADAAGILPATLRITAVNGAAVSIAPDPKWTSKLYTGDSAEFEGMAGVTYLMTKFPRSEVAAVIPEGEFSLKVSGRLADGRVFSGESMNRALASKVSVTVLADKREGERAGPGGVKVNVPQGAFNGNPDLLLTAAPEDAEELGRPEKEKRDAGMKAKGVAAASEAFEFGPHGTTFEKPVAISLPYRAELLPPGADESALKVAYWNEASGEWELLASSVSEGDKLVTAETGHFSVYQVVAPAPVEPPASEPVVATPPPAEPPAEEPAVSIVTVAEPPAAEPPAVEPVVVTPPPAEPPAAELPAVEPVVVTPPPAEPPAEEPAVSTVTAAEPPAAGPAVSTAPAVELPAAAIVPAPAPAPAPAASSFSLGSAYVFPNPAKGGAVPVLHVAASAGDKLTVRVYTASGRQAYEAVLTGAPGTAGGEQAYELELRGQFTSGVYYYQAEVRSGAARLKKAGKFAVVR